MIGIRICAIISTVWDKRAERVVFFSTFIFVCRMGRNTLFCVVNVSQFV